MGNCHENLFLIFKQRFLAILIVSTAVCVWFTARAIKTQATLKSACGVTPWGKECWKSNMMMPKIFASSKIFFLEHRWGLFSLTLNSAFTLRWRGWDFSLQFFSYHLSMPRPGIELTIAELHLLEGPFKDTLPTELHGRRRIVLLK